MYDPFKALCDKITSIQTRYDDPGQRESAEQEAISLWKQMNPGLNRPPKDDSPIGQRMSKLSNKDAIVASMLTPEQCRAHGFYN